MKEIRSAESFSITTSKQSPVGYKVLSSPQLAIWHIFGKRSKSIIKILKIKRHEIDPCGTPAMTQVLYEFLMTVIRRVYRNASWICIMLYFMRPRSLVLNA